MPRNSLVRVTSPTRNPFTIISSLLQKTGLQNYLIIGQHLYVLREMRELQYLTRIFVAF